MQVINLDLSQKGAYPLVEAKQKDVGRKLQFNLSDAGASYPIPEASVFTIWYSGPSGEGNYSSIDTKIAFSFEPNSNIVVIELITQMLTIAGVGSMCLTITNADKQIGLWNLRYIVEGIPGGDSPEAKQYYTALSSAANRAEAAANRAEQLVGSSPGGQMVYHRQSREAYDQFVTDYGIVRTGDVVLIDNEDEAGNTVLYQLLRSPESNEPVLTPITALGKGKVNVTDIVNNLTTGGINKPLSAEQGVILKNITDALNAKLAKTPGCLIVHATLSGGVYVLDKTTMEILQAISNNADVRLWDTATGFFHHLSWANVTNGMPYAIFSGVEFDGNQELRAVAYFVSPDNTATKTYKQLS